MTTSMGCRFEPAMGLCCMAAAAKFLGLMEVEQRHRMYKGISKLDGEKFLHCLKLREEHRAEKRGGYRQSP